MRNNIILISMIMILLTAGLVAAETENILGIEFSLDKQSSVQLLSLKPDYGIPDSTEETEYSIALLSSDGSELSNTYFNAAFVAWPDNGFPYPPGSEQDIAQYNGVELDNLQIYVNAPYSKDISKVEIRKDGNQIFNQEISLCNSDGTCTVINGENYISCESDCPSGSEDGLCDMVFDEKCDPDCKAEGREDRDTDCTCGNGVCDPREDGFYCAQDCGETANTFMYTIVGGVIGVVVLIIVLVVLLIVAAKKKKSKK